MGNKLGKQEDEFEKMVRRMKSKQSNSPLGAPTKITVNPEQKYLSVMIDKLSSSNLPEQLKNKLSLTLHEKLLKEELIKTVSIANVLKNNQFDIQASKNTIINSSNGKKDYSSNNVKFNFNFNKINPYIKKNLLHKSGYKNNEVSKEDLQNYQKQLTQDQKKKIQEEKEIRDSQTKINYESAMQILRQQIKKMHHPFWKLNKSFADYVSNQFCAFLKKPQTGCSNDPEKYQTLIRKLLYSWCVYLEQGCLFPYKKWLIAYLQLPDSKLTKGLHSVLLQQIFTINSSYLYHSVMMLIAQHRPGLKISFSMLKQQQDLITPELFSINENLQIEGNFFISTYQCSQLQSPVNNKPQKILKQLQLLKHSICKDIDQYHKLDEKQQFYEIDSDNILGIVNFILTRIPNKIDGIYKQIIFLRIVYGDSVYFSHGISSYMLSTLSGSMQFLESEQFMKLIKQNPLASKKPISPPTMAKEQSVTTNTEQENKQSILTAQNKNNADFKLESQRKGIKE